MVAAECGRECVGRAVADAPGDARHAEFARAFVEAADIAAVAAETLLAPEFHDGALYAPTGPQALTVADIITAVTGQSVTHQDLDAEAWIGGAVAAGIVPDDYAVMLRWPTGTIITGHGSTPNDDIEKVTGQKATSFHEFAQRNAHAWTVVTGTRGS
ncbi:hypothetical protein [Streptomyces sp. Tue6028]|uniref:hypothetical protein n=1 Tax=Streptomyces sp. Tue6028 TaxID=2036037 RepID=UPI003D70AD2D